MTQPRYTYAAVEWLRENVARDAVVFEYGMGASTVFFADRVERLVSVEHDTKWYYFFYCEQTLDFTTMGALDNTILLLRPPTPGVCAGFASSDYPDQCFRDYVLAIDAYPDESFDFVLVDGRARVACIRVSIPKVKRGGYLLLDNSERSEYSIGKALLARWTPMVFAGLGPSPEPGVDYRWETTIWKKPKGAQGDR